MAHPFFFFNPTSCHPERSDSGVKDLVIFQEGFVGKDLFPLRCKRLYPIYKANACSAGWGLCHFPRVGTRGYSYFTPPGFLSYQPASM